MRLHFSGIILAITEYHVACSGTIRRNENENTCSITRKVRNIHEKQTKTNAKANANFYVTMQITCENEHGTHCKQANSKRKQTQKQTYSFSFVFFGKNKTLKLLGQLTEKGNITKFGNERGTRYKRNA